MTSNPTKWYRAPPTAAPDRAMSLVSDERLRALIRGDGDPRIASGEAEPSGIVVDLAAELLLARAIAAAMLPFRTGGLYEPECGCDDCTALTAALAAYDAGATP